MKLIHGNVKRCGIFLFYDKQGIVDDYIIYMLKDLKKSVEDILVVCNGAIPDMAKERFASVGTTILERENEGFDVAGYKAGIFHLGFEKLSSYDEVVLFNYTFFGPLYPFEEMFTEMEERDVDFWGITKHHAVYPDPFGKNRYGYMPEHLQSHFLVIRKSMVGSREYQRFMLELENPKSYVDSICNYETIFTKHFEDKGFKWQAYCDSDEYKEYVYNPIMFRALEMIRDKRCPIIKRRSFFTDYQDFMLNSCGEVTFEALEYIENNLSYDMSLIWQNLLRLENMTEMSRAMQLQYILQDECGQMKEFDKKVCAVVHVSNVKHMGIYLSMLKNIADKGTLCVFCNSEIRAGLEATLLDNNIEAFFSIVHDSKDVLSSIRKVASEIDADYLAFLTIEEEQELGQYCNSTSVQYSSMKNMIGSKKYIQAVINTFEDNPHVGMLVPPVPSFGSFYAKFQELWKESFDCISQTLKNYGIDVNMKITELPLAPVDGSFWIKKNLLQTVLDNCSWIEELDRVQQRFVIPFVVQFEKHFIGVIHNSEYLATEITNLDYEMRELNKTVFQKFGPSFHSIVLQRIQSSEKEEKISFKRRIKNLLKRMAKKLPDKLYWKLIALKNRIR